MHRTVPTTRGNFCLPSLYGSSLYGKKQFEIKDANINLCREGSSFGKYYLIHSTGDLLLWLSEGGEMKLSSRLPGIQIVALCFWLWWQIIQGDGINLHGPCWKCRQTLNLQDAPLGLLECHPYFFASAAVEEEWGFMYFYTLFSATTLYS